MSLSNLYTPLLFEKKHIFLKSIGQKLLFKAGSSQAALDTCKAGK